MLFTAPMVSIPLVALCVFSSVSAAAPASFMIMRGGPRSIANPGDVNGDGRADLAVGIGSGVLLVSGSDSKVLWKSAGAVYERLACSVARLPDVDGDGADDLLVGNCGIRRSDSRLPLPSTVVLFGPRRLWPTGSARVLSGRDGRTLRAWEGLEPQEAFGFEVRPAGDVDADGVVDVIIGAPDRANGCGAAEVYSGRDGARLWTFEGEAEYAHFGTSVSGAGDVNGDGHADLLVGAPGLDGTWDSTRGGAFIYCGKTGELIRRIAPIGCEAEGPRRACRFGISVSDAGDLDHDGFADVVVGADAASRSCGNAWVFKGSDGTVLFELGPGGPFFTSFGSSVTSIPDVNGDGEADLVVSDPAYFDEAQAQGSVAAFSGKDGDMLWRVVGERMFSMLGECVEGSADRNGDSIPDVLARGGSSVHVLSGKDGTTLLDLPLSELAGEACSKAPHEADER